MPALEYICLKEGRDGRTHLVRRNEMKKNMKTGSPSHGPFVTALSTEAQTSNFQLLPLFRLRCCHAGKVNQHLQHSMPSLQQQDQDENRTSNDFSHNGDGCELFIRMLMQRLRLKFGQGAELELGNGQANASHRSEGGAKGAKITPHVRRTPENVPPKPSPAKHHVHHLVSPTSWEEQVTPRVEGSTGDSTAGRPAKTRREQS